MAEFIRQVENRPQLTVEVMMRLAALSPAYASEPLALVHTKVVNAVIANQTLIRVDEGYPTAFVCWGLFTPVTAAKFRLDFDPMTPEELKGGEQVWITFGASPLSLTHGDELTAELITLHGTNIHYLDDGEMRVVEKRNDDS